MPRPTRSAPNDSHAHLPALTGVRFFAALYVVLFHYLRAEHVEPRPLQALLASGHVAVGLFFVLSGFILAYTYGAESDLLDRRRFWAARFARIYPVYLLGLALAAPFFVRDHVRTHTWFALAAESAAVLTGTQAWVPSLAIAWNTPAWSLSVEAFFYAIFPALASVVLRVRPRVAFAIAALAWGLSLTMVFAYVTLAPDGLASITRDTDAFWLVALKYGPLARLPEFVVGVALGRLYLAGALEPLRPHAGALAFASVVVLFGVLASGAIPYVWAHNGALIPLVVLVVASLALGGGALGKTLGSRTLVALGEASYALYILHVPLEEWLHSLAKRVAPALLAERVFVPVCVAVTVASSVLVYRRFEVPMRDRLKRTLSRTLRPQSRARGAAP